MSLTIRYGVPAPAVVRKGYGLLAFTSNVFYENEVTGEVANDAALVLARRAFSYGKSYIAIRRNEAYKLLNDDGLFLAQTADDCADFLWNGHATDRERHVVMDALLENIDQLVMHKPEGEDLNRKALDKYFEGEHKFTHGLMDIANS